MKFLAGLEADRLAGCDGHLGTGARVSSHASLAGLDGEDAEAAELDAITFYQALLHGFEDGVHGCFSLGANQSGTFYYSLNQILFDHFDASSVRVCNSPGNVPVSRNCGRMESKIPSQKTCAPDALSSAPALLRW
jgi:hypothetical protein